MFRVLKIFLGATLLGMILIAGPSQAQVTKVTSAYKDKLLVVEASQPVGIKKVFAPVVNGDLQLISEFYQIDSPVSDFKIKFFYNHPSQYSRVIYSYNKDLDKWQPMASYHDFSKKMVSTDVVGQTQPLIVAIFENQIARDGEASFYDQSRYRAFGRKNGDFAASRDYPKGTKLRVTRLLTGQSVDVVVNDYGPAQSTGRLIDLDVSAFKKIGPKSAGIIYVKVEEL